MNKVSIILKHNGIMLNSKLPSYAKSPLWICYITYCYNNHGSIANCHLEPLYVTDFSWSQYIHSKLFVCCFLNLLLLFVYVTLVTFSTTYSLGIFLMKDHSHQSWLMYLHILNSYELPGHWKQQNTHKNHLTERDLFYPSINLFRDKVVVSVDEWNLKQNK